MLISKEYKHLNISDTGKAELYVIAFNIAKTYLVQITHGLVLITVETFNVTLTFTGSMSPPLSLISPMAVMQSTVASRSRLTYKTYVVIHVAKYKTPDDWYRVSPNQCLGMRHEDITHCTTDSPL